MPEVWSGCGFDLLLGVSAWFRASRGSFDRNDVRVAREERGCLRITRDRVFARTFWHPDRLPAIEVSERAPPHLEGLVVIGDPAHGDLPRRYVVSQLGRGKGQVFGQVRPALDAALADRSALVTRRARDG